MSHSPPHPFSSGLDYRGCMVDPYIGTQTQDPTGCEVTPGGPYFPLNGNAMLSTHVLYDDEELQTGTYGPPVNISLQGYPHPSVMPPGYYTSAAFTPEHIPPFNPDPRMHTFSPTIGRPFAFRATVDSPGFPSPIVQYPANFTYHSSPQSAMQSPITSPAETFTDYYGPDGHAPQDSSLIPHGTMSRKRHSVASGESQKMKERSTDPRFLQVVKTITRIMTEVEVPKDGSRPPMFVQKYQELSDYLGSITDPDILLWFQEFRPEVGNPAGKEIAHGKRKPDEDGKLFVCLWCCHTLTVKNNLGNHIRSHLRFYLSFCNHCRFKSVTPILPTRHCCPGTPPRVKKDTSVSRVVQPHHNTAGPSTSVSMAKPSLGSYVGAPTQAYWDLPPTF